jgi:hypothetical protein
MYGESAISHQQYRSGLEILPSMYDERVVLELGSEAAVGRWAEILSVCQPKDASHNKILPSHNMYVCMYVCMYVGMYVGM